MGKKEDYFRSCGPKKHSPELIVRDYVLIYSLYSQWDTATLLCASSLEEAVNLSSGLLAGSQGTHYQTCT